MDESVARFWDLFIENQKVMALGLRRSNGMCDMPSNILVASSLRAHRHWAACESRYPYPYKFPSMISYLPISSTVTLYMPR